MKESKGFKMLNEGYLSCIGRLNKRLINFHKDILKNYLRPLGANSLGFLESYFGLRMFRSPGVEMLNLPEVEMIYLIQPVMNSLSMEEGLNSEEKPSAYPSVEGQVKGLLLETRKKAISGGSANLIKSFLPIYKHKYIPAFMESLFYKGLKLKQDRIHLDSNSETFSAVKTAKSEIFTTRKEIFFGRGKFDLTTPKRLALLDHMLFPALQESKVADTVTPQPIPVAADIFFSLLKTQSRRPTFFSDNTVGSVARTAKSEIFTTRKEIFFGRGKFDLTTPKRLALLDHMPFPALQESKVADTVTPQPIPVAADIFFSLFKTQSRKPTFFSDNTVINGAKQVQPILHLGRSSLRMHKFIPMIDTQHTRMKKDALSDEHASFSSQLIFVDRHHNSSRSLKVMRVKENTNSRKDVKSYPIGFEPSGLTAQAQHSVDYELIADRVYDIIENRLRIEKERE